LYKLSLNTSTRSCTDRAHRTQQTTCWMLLTYSFKCRSAFSQLAHVMSTRDHYA